MTAKLYGQDAYLKSFTATVTGCEPRGDKWELTLDRTAFYPEGGGQPGDSGWLRPVVQPGNAAQCDSAAPSVGACASSGGISAQFDASAPTDAAPEVAALANAAREAGAVRISDTHSRGESIVHTSDTPLEAGVQVTGEIDWDERFSRMQHHSGEHIVSGLIHRLYGFDNVGFHMGRDAVTIDISGELSVDSLETVERLANEAVWANLPISEEFPAADQLSALDYRSKKELSGAVRIVTVPGCDVCACCGTHVKLTGEIGAIKLLTSQRYKGGVRVWLLCGERARADYAAKNREVYEIAALLSVKPEAAAEAVRRLHAENGAAAARAASLSSKLLAERAEKIPEGTPLVLRFEEDMPPAELGKWCVALSERCAVAAVFSGGAGGEFSYAVGSQSEDVRPLTAKLNAAFAGRGGGRRELAQGKLCGKRAEIEKFCRTELV